MWKSYLNIVLGGLSVVLIIGGFLWFFRVEMSPESAGAVVGGLLSLLGWFQTREDKKEQAKDKAEIIDVIRAERKTIPVVIDGYASDAHRQADLRLLRTLWSYIGGKKLRRLTSYINNRSLRVDYYARTVASYIQSRGENPEAKFINPRLEQKFQDFDQLMNEFENQFLMEQQLDGKMGTEVYTPMYKFRPSGSEAYHYDLESHRKTLQLSSKLADYQAILVKDIKQILPEFEFEEYIEADF